APPAQDRGECGVGPSLRAGAPLCSVGDHSPLPTPLVFHYVRPMQDPKDITIIGAGQTGLFGCFYAGMRGASCSIIDNLDQAGGHLTALYPEKYIFDVAGFPKVLAKDLVKGMAEQALQFKSPVHLGEKV